MSLQGLEVKVWRAYEEFIEDLTKSFPHERDGIRKFYDECWRVFNSLNSLDLKSLEEPRYLLGGDGPSSISDLHIIGLSCMGALIQHCLGSACLAFVHLSHSFSKAMSSKLAAEFT